MHEQACQVTVLSQNIVSHAGTLRPRLTSTVQLIDLLIIQLDTKRIQIQQINDMSINENNFSSLEKGITEEHLIHKTVASLNLIKVKLTNVSLITSIPIALSSTVSISRILSSSLFNLMPEVSQQLCELSTNLGSIVVDSAILTNTKCNFELSNKESARILDEAKLMADSKIGKLYPNLDSIKENNT